MGSLRTLFATIALGAAAATAALIDPLPLDPGFQVDLSPAPLSVQLVDVAGSPTGEFVVVWSQAGYDRTYAHAFDPNGVGVSGDVLVGPSNDDGGFQVSRYPRVAANAAGAFVVAWTQGDDYASPPRSIRARVLDDTATPQGSSFEVAPLETYQFSASIASRPSGEFVVAWDDAPSAGSGTQDVYGRRLDAAGALDGAAFAIEVGATHEEEAPEVAATPGGGFVAVWSTDDAPPATLVGQRFDATNAPVGSQFVVTTDAVIGYYPAEGRRHAVASNAAGEFVVAWQSDSTGSIMVQRFDAAAVPNGTALEALPRTNSDYYGPDVVMEDDGGFVVTAVADTFGVRLRRFAADAGELGGNLRVTVPVDVDVPPSITSTGPGRFVVAWGSYAGRHVRARRFAVPTDVGISGRKLLILQKDGFNRDKVVYLAKNDPENQNRSGCDPALLTGLFDVVYTERPESVAGAFVIDAPWSTLTDGVAKYHNRLAPSIGAVRIAVVKNGRTAKIVARARGEGPTSKIDLVEAGPPTDADGVTTALTVVNGNDGTARRMCTRFSVADGSTVLFKEIGGGTGRKLIAKNGVPAACP